MSDGALLTALRHNTWANLEELVARATSNGERIERLIDGGVDASRFMKLRRGGTASAGILVSQSVHHGSDHRAHIGTILGAHGVEPPYLDVWAYGAAIGEVTPS